MTKNEKLIKVGCLSAPHGILGAMLLISYTNPKSNIFNFSLCDEQRRVIPIKLQKLMPNKIVCSLTGVTTRNEAERLRNTFLYINEAQLPELDSDEYYIEKLRGLDVKDQLGVSIAKVFDVCNYGSVDLIEIQYHNGLKRMYPFTRKIFPMVEKEFIIIIPPNEID